MRPALFPMLAWTAFMTLGLAVVGCENKQDTKANVLPLGAATADVTGDAGLPGDGTTTANECACLQPDLWFRFDSLTLTSLDGGPHPVIKTLNGLWAVDIDHKELNFYFHVVAVTPTSVKFEVVNGARIEDPQPLCKCSTGGDKCDAPARTTDTCLLDAKASLDTTVAIEFPREGCHLKPSAKAGINVYAGTTTGTKNCAPTLPVQHAIPVRSAILQAEMGPECQTIEDGLVLDGSFSEFALGKICTCVATSAQFTCPTCGKVDPTFVPGPSDDKECAGCNSKYQSLKSLLELFGDLQYGCKAEDGGKAVCLTAAFHGVRIAAPPPSCGQLK